LPEGLGWVLLGVLVPLITPATLIWAIRRRRALRHLCLRCDVAREAPEDRAAHLSAGQLAEERLDRLTYDLLVCPSCGDVRCSGAPDAAALAFRCTSCGFCTLEEHEDGLRCAHCG